MNSGWVYIKSEPQLYTVGFYDPDGNWNPESDWGTTDEAASRVHFLNGGNCGGADEVAEEKGCELCNGPALNSVEVTEIGGRTTLVFLSHGDTKPRVKFCPNCSKNLG